MIGSLHLPFRFETARLRQDLKIAQTVPWQRHYNEQEYGGLWSGVALRSTTGGAGNIDAGATGARQFRDTSLLDACHYFREVLGSFPCPLKSVRLLSLDPGSFIREHSDFGMSYDDGEIRVHVPIETNPDVEFYVAGERLVLEAGHSYFLNVNLPHRVNNRGKNARIHLVIDAEVNEWVHGLFSRGVEQNWSVPRSALPPRNIEEFRVFVAKNPQLQGELQAIDDSRDFGERVTKLGNAHGFDFHDGDVDAALRCGPIRDLGEGLPDGSGWTPVHVDCAGGEPVVRWLHTGNQRFVEPFFEDSIRIALRKPFARMFQIETSFDAVRRRVAGTSAKDPAGFILHVSRCGSTLVSQMLAAAGFGVISEAPPIDDVLTAGNPEWFRITVRALIQGEGGEDGRSFVKLDAWHNREHAVIREAFPETPWILVVRDPLEVLVSQMARPGHISIPGSRDAAAFGVDPALASTVAREEWCTRVLEEIYESAIQAAAGGDCRVIDYGALPGAVFESIARHFRANLSAVQLSRMHEAAAYDAKNPGVTFEGDTQRKQALASPAIRELCARRLNGYYEELLARSRMQQNGAGSPSDPLAIPPLRPPDQFPSPFRDGQSRSDAGGFAGRGSEQ